jgi:hypothetical protein
MNVNEITVDSYSWYFKRLFASNDGILKPVSKEIKEKIGQLKSMVGKAVAPFLGIKKLKRSLLSYRQITLELEAALGPAVDFLKSIPISDTARRQNGADGPNEQEEIKYIVVMTKAGWPPLFDVPIDFIRRINSQYQSLGREAFRAYATKEITELYDKKVIAGMLVRWSKQKKLEALFPLLKGALAAYTGRKYDLALPMLTAMIEGIMTKTNGPAGAIDPEQFSAYVDSLFSEKNDYLALKGMIIDNLIKDFKWGDRAILSMSRQALLHGVAAACAARDHSLKLILVLDMMIHIL